MLAMDRRCPPTNYVGLMCARQTNRDLIALAARPLGIFACLALSWPNLADLVLRGTVRLVKSESHQMESREPWSHVVSGVTQV